MTDTVKAEVKEHTDGKRTGYTIDDTMSKEKVAIYQLR